MNPHSNLTLASIYLLLLNMPGSKYVCILQRYCLCVKANKTDLHIHSITCLLNHKKPTYIRRATASVSSIDLTL